MSKFLTFLLLCSAADTCVGLNDNDKIKIAAGVGAVATGLWTYWSHVSNKNATIGAERLWDECHHAIGKEESYLSNDLQKSLCGLRSSAILIHADEIIVAHDALKWKNNFFWNRSSRMQEALSRCKILKKSVEAYQDRLFLIKQKITIERVAQLWQELSCCDWRHDPSCDVIQSSTLRNLSRHALVYSRDLINDLYKELHGVRSYCLEFAQAQEQIRALKHALDTYVSVINQIKTYDEIMGKYNDLSRIDVIIAAKLCSHDCLYPLLVFEKELVEDVSKLKALTLSFAYFKFRDVVVSCENAKTVATECLQKIYAQLIASPFYQKELFCYREKLRMEAEQRRIEEEQQRLEYEQRRLNKKLKQVDRELDEVKDELNRQKYS